MDALGTNWLTRHSNVMTKDSILLINIVPVVYICQLRKKIVPLLPEGTDKHIHQAAVANSLKILNEINKSGATDKV